MSDFGLVQITRQRIRTSVVNSVSKVCPTCGGSGNVVTKNTIEADLDAWISKFKHHTDYRSIDIYINPYLKSYLEKGFLSKKRKWMLKYWVKITLVPDETVSLNEYKVTLSGSDIDITDAVMRNEDLDDLLYEDGVDSNEPDTRRKRDDQLDYYKKERPKRGSNQSSNGNSRDRGSSKSKYYKTTS
jgi:ribonuclease G